MFGLLLCMSAAGGHGLHGPALLPHRSPPPCIPSAPNTSDCTKHNNAHQQLHGLLAAHGHIARDLLVTTDGERAHGVARLAVHGHLASQLLQHLRQVSPGRVACLIAAGRVPGVHALLRASLPSSTASDSACVRLEPSKWRHRNLGPLQHWRRPSRTLAAFCRRSPDSPTQMLSTSLLTRMSRIGLEALSSAVGPRGTRAGGVSVRVHRRLCRAAGATNRRVLPMQHVHYSPILPTCC